MLFRSTDPNYTGTTDATLSIAKAAATVSLSDLTTTYDGTPKPVSFVTSPTGLTVDVTYDGLSTAPSAQGTYTVVATIRDNNYRGTATGTLLVANALATVTISNLSATYDGNSHAVQVSTDPAGLAVDVTYNGSSTPPTDAGTYTVVATVNDPNWAGSATSTLVIDKAVATITLGALNTTYDGNTHAATITTSPTGLAADVTYNASATEPTDAGTYTVVATVNDQDYTGTATDSLVIDKAPATVTLADLNHVFDGLGHTVTPSTTPAGLTVIVTYDGSTTPPVDAGAYNVVATITDPNYTGSATAQMVVDRKSTRLNSSH